MKALCLLLGWAALSVAVPGVPIYCRRFKGDCRAKHPSACCKYQDLAGSTTTTRRSTTTGATTAAYDEEYADELETGDGDPLHAEPSYVEEVFVKPPPLELNEVTAPEEEPSEEEEPSPSAPRPSTQHDRPHFCSILKFNCATRSGHPCCRGGHQEPAANRRSGPGQKPAGRSPPLADRKGEEEDATEDIEETDTTAAIAAAADLSKKEQKSKFRKPSKSKYGSRSKTAGRSPPKSDRKGKEEDATKDIEEADTTAAVAEAADLIKKEQKSKFRKPSKSKYGSRSKSRSLFGKKPPRVKTTNPPKQSTISTAAAAAKTPSPPKKKPTKRFNKSSLFGRRPGGFDTSKSALCRIVHCGRSPGHKCCAPSKEEAIELQEAEVTTTTETHETTPEWTTLAAPRNADQQEGETTEAAADEGITEMADLEADHTEAPIEGPVEENEDSTDISVVLEDVESTTIYSMEVVAEVEVTTTKDQEASTVPSAEEESKAASDEDAGSGEVVVPEDEEEGSGPEAGPKDDPEASAAGEARGESEEGSGTTRAPPPHPAMHDAPGAEDSPEGETLEAFLASYTTEPSYTTTQRVIAPVYIPPWATIAPRHYLDIDQAARTIDIVDSNNLDSNRRIDLDLDSNHLEEVEAEEASDWMTEEWTDCRQFDCLASPEHPCCEPHRSDKRQTSGEPGQEQTSWGRVTVLSLPGFNSVVAPLVLEYPGRVTATVTRVEKSYSWSPWRPI